MNKPLKIVYFGTSDFALEPLKVLCESGHEITAVVTRPDSKGGRSLGLIQSPVKKLALDKNLVVLEYQKINDAKSQLEELGADLFIVCSYGIFLPESILKLAKLYALNIHPSLLPKYRGAAPIRWALINGDKYTGVTIQKISKKMDTGDIALQKEMPIEVSDNVQSLSIKLSLLSGKMILELIDSINDGTIAFRPQDDDQATLARALEKEDGLINWNKPAAEVHNLIRGVSGWPGAYFFYHEKRIKVHESLVVEVPEEIIKGKEFKPAEVVLADKRQGLVIKCKEGFIRLLVLQAEGKKVLDDTAFLVGSLIMSGDKLEKVL
jgi:methionyl-tRNA formyltransferase